MYSVYYLALNLPVAFPALDYIGTSISGIFQWSMEATPVLPRFLVRVVFAVVISPFAGVHITSFCRVHFWLRDKKLRYCRRELVMLTLYMLLECRFENVWAWGNSECDPYKTVLSDVSLNVSLNQVIEPENPLCVSVLLVHSNLNEGLLNIPSNAILLHPISYQNVK